MTTHRLIQNFRRSRGLLWASPDFNADVLERTLLKLGVSLRRVESVSASDLDTDRDIVLPISQSILRLFCSPALTSPWRRSLELSASRRQVG
jgi:hypothetical protein